MRFRVVDYALLTPRGSEQARAGDPTLDVETVYEQQADFVWRSLQHLGVRGSDLDDLLQEVFVVVHRRLHTFDGSSKLTTWLFGICLRTASRHRRRAYFRWERLTRVLPEARDPSTPEDRLAERQAQAILDRVLDRLSLDKRAVFVLFEIEGQNCQAIAELLDIPIGTVHSRLHAARKQVSRALTTWRAAQERQEAR